ncbi:MAG: hypothetical protein AAF957_26475 [Planctomycetota bacterium]
MSDEIQDEELEGTHEGRAGRRGERGCLRALGRRHRALDPVDVPSPASPRGPRPRAERRMWRDVVAREGREEHTRVVPLPFALAAVLLPFLAAWASAGSAIERDDPPKPELIAWSSGPLGVLGRTDRAPERSGGYVDVWRAPEPWEADVLQRSGYVRPEKDQRRR